MLWFGRNRRSATFAAARSDGAPPGIVGAQVVEQDGVVRCEVVISGTCSGGRFALRLDPRRRTHAGIARALAQRQLYEPNTSLVALELLRPNDWAVDVGAHAGYYTLLFASLVGGTGRVFAFEPNISTYLHLIENVVAHPDQVVLPFQAAVADHVGQETFYVNLDNDGESALWDVSQVEAFAETHRSPTVQATSIITLDRAFARIEPTPIRLVKLDAEGAEGKILRGASEFFTRFRPDAVICEINGFALAQCGSDEREIRRAFDRMGYEPYVINLIGRGEFDLCNGKAWRRLEGDEAIVTRAIYNLLFLRPDVSLPDRDAVR